MKPTVADLSVTRDAFDRIAPEFDQVVGRNSINSWMRETSRRWIRTVFPPGSRLLDLGCGSGADAAAFAEEGYQILAVDLAPEMVAATQAKARALGRTDRLRAVCGRLGEVDRLISASPWDRFDGAYANFSLAYEPSLRSVLEAVHRVLESGGMFLCTLPNRLALSEVVLYGPQLRFGHILRRFRETTWMDVHGIRVPFHAYSSGEVTLARAGLFHLVHQVGVPVFVPPPYLFPWWNRLGRARQALTGLDGRWAGRFPWNRLGDHTLYGLKRVDFGASPR
ncbi:MAG: class I SAM-dependent methyltransferase [Thermoplasmata archaeon]|nr:class I SAM-dependent methyltransferase [Thermoplasmata archaeon]